MFITRKQYEKNIRKAKKKARNEFAYQMGLQKELDDIRRTLYESFDNIRNRTNERFGAVEKDIAKIKKELAIE